MIDVSHKVQGSNSGTVPVAATITTVLPATLPVGASLYSTIFAYVLGTDVSFPSIQTTVRRNSRYYTQVASAYGTDELFGEGTLPMTYVVRVLKLDAPDAGSYNTIAQVASASDPAGSAVIDCQQFLIYNHDDDNVDTDYISGSSASTADLDAPVETNWGAVAFGGFAASQGTWPPLPTVTHGLSSADTSTKIKETYGGLFMIRGAMPADGYLGASGSWSTGGYIGTYYAINSKGIH